MQKSVKDRVQIPICNPTLILFFHTECPNWIPKFEGKDAKTYLKRQYFQHLALAYAFNSINEVTRGVGKLMTPKNIFNTKEKTIKYPHEFVQFDFLKDDVKNKELMKRHFEFYNDNPDVANRNGFFPKFYNNRTAATETAEEEE